MLRTILSGLSVAVFLLAALARADDPPAVPPYGQPLPQAEDRRFPLLPFQGRGELFDIPPGYKRPIEVDEGELIPVRRFVLSGIDSNSELASYREQLLAILARERESTEQRNRELRSQRPDDEDLYEDADDEDLYDDADADEAAQGDDATAAPAEPGEATDGTAGAQGTGADATAATPADAGPSGMTIGQIQQAANVAAAFLREEGFFLVQAVLPEQTVVDGEVNVLFLPGNLGEVRVENNRWYSERQFQGLYEDMIGKPVHRRRLERGILGMQEMPGLKSYATLVRGRSVGETDLLIRTQEENRHDFALSLNNNNLSQTGAWQTQFDYSLNNLFGVSDALSLSLRTSVAPFNNQFYSVAYNLPLSHTTSLYFNLYRVQYKIDADDNFDEISGSTLNLTTRFQWHIVRQRYRNLYLSGVLDWTSLANQAGTIDSSSRISTFALSLAVDWVEIRGKSLNTLDLSYSLGLPGFLGADEILPAGEPAPLDRIPGDADFKYLQATYQRLQTINTNNSILLQLRYHWSGDVLYSIHKATIGGADSFRALPSSALLREMNFMTTVEYILAPFSSRRFNDALTWGQVLQFSLFVDHTIALRADDDISQGASTAEDPDGAHLTGVGLSAQFNIPDLIKVRFDYAFLVRNSATRSPSILGGGIVSEFVYGDSAASQSKSRFYFELAYYF